MSRHREILPKVLDVLVRRAPDAAVFLSGSVCFGSERPDSDIDLVVIVPDVIDVDYPGGRIRDQDRGFKFVDAAFDGVALEIIFLTPSFFEELVVGKPWRGYKFLRTEILRDPDGLIQSWKDRIRPWFEDHPDVAELWQKWLAQHADRRRTKGKKLGDIIRKFPDMMSDLWPYLDQCFSGQATAERSAPGLPAADPRFDSG